jgi:ribosomal protein S12 methylthiotransferase accessory factor
MPMKYGLDLAPWVVQKDLVLLGSQLKAIQVPHLDMSKIPVDRTAHLLETHYLIETGADNVNPSPRIAWIWISDASFLSVALVLKQHLSQIDDTMHWELALDPLIILADSQNASVPPFVIRLSHKELIDPVAIQALYGPLIGKTRLFWLGETTEGTHVGPLIQTTQDLEYYLQATQAWYFSKQLINFGFNHEWPLLIYTHLMRHPERVAQAMVRIMTASSSTCILLEDNREVILWTKLLNESISEEELFKTQFWSKGIIRNFHNYTFDTLNEGYITGCRTPCNGMDHLEGNSGKGLDLKSATYSCVGEAVERFSAWQGQRLVCFQNDPLDARKKIIHSIHDFHPFGPKWDRYLIGPAVDLPVCAVKNLSAFETQDQHFVPECLIPFPYQPSEVTQDVSTYCTGGLAVYSDYTKAVIKGALELLERENFYTHFLFQKPGFILEFSNTLTDNMIKNHLRYWCIVYDSSSKLPIVHCIIHDQTQHFLSRGSGSGYTLEEAISGALAEALQLRQQFLKKEAHEAKGYQDWRDPIVMEWIQSYLAQFQTLSLHDHPLSQLQYTPDQLLTEIKQKLHQINQPLLVADLHCPIIGWHAVRVLIPGLPTHQYPSQSLGGQKIMHLIFTYGVPT